MLPIDQIQNALKGIDQATFQKLCDEYHCRILDVKEIRSRGTVPGSAKTRVGQPDTLIELTNGKYVLVEATTQQEGVAKKLSEDLDECFKEAKTGVSLSDIEKIVLACNRNLSVDDRKDLADQGKKNGCIVEFLELDNLSHALKARFPVLAREYLGVELDTGQILEPDDYVKDYEKSSLATTLSNEFLFRTKEKQEVSKALEAYGLVFLTGKAGVGKTKLALECAKTWQAKNPGTRVYCIGNKNLDLYDNIRLYFSDNANYLIIVDDANRLNVQFAYFLELLKGQGGDRSVKIIATIRDYAVQHVKRNSRAYESFEINISPFSDGEIRELLDKGFNIRNPDFTGRICAFSNGNARLAVMAAEVVNRQGDLQSISDVSSLYDSYFQSINDDLKKLGGPDLLKVAGIISYFRILDRTNDAFFTAVAASFGLSATELWSGLEKLHEFELVDIDFRVAKISDQILATYLFYKTFLKEEVTDFSVLLHKPYEKLLHLLKDSLFPAWEAFDTSFIRAKLRPHILNRWEEIKDDPSLALAFAERFHFVAETEFLVYLKAGIEQLPVNEVVTSELSFAVPVNLQVSDLYLAVLRRMESDSIAVVLDLIFRRLEKDLSVLPQVIRILTEDFCFDHHAHRWDYAIQEAVISRVIDLTEKGDLPDVYKPLLIAISATYLQMQFRSNVSKGMKVTIYTIPLRPRPVIHEIRTRIWNKLFEIYEDGQYREEIRAVLTKYERSGYGDAVVKEIAIDDAATLVPFLNGLDPDKYEDCVLVHDFCKYFDRCAIKYDKAIKEKFTNPTFELAEVLLSDDYGDPTSDWKVRDEQKRQFLKDNFASYDFHDYVQFFNYLEQIQKHSDNQRRGTWLLEGSVSTVLANLADSDADLFQEVTTHLLQSGNRVGLRPDFIVQKLVQISPNLRQAYDDLRKHNFIHRGTWLVHFLGHLPPATVDSYFAAQLYDVYRTVPLEEVPGTFEFLGHFECVEPGFVPKVAKVLFDRATRGGIPFSFRYLLSFAAGRLSEMFLGELGLLKAIYIYEWRIDRYPDFKSQTLREIVLIDGAFIYEFLGFLMDEKTPTEILTSMQLDLSFFWEGDEYLAAFEGIVDFILSRERDMLYRIGPSFVEIFFHHFHVDEKGMTEEQIQRKQELTGRALAALKALMEKYASDGERAAFIFQIVTNSFGDHRKDFLALFLAGNTSFDDFKHLDFKTNYIVAADWGSRIPQLEAQITFLRSILPLFLTADLIEHRQHVEARIEALGRQILEEKKRDFAQMD